MKLWRRRMKIALLSVNITEVVCPNGKTRQAVFSKRKKNFSRGKKYVTSRNNRKIFVCLEGKPDETTQFEKSTHAHKEPTFFREWL